MAIAESVIAGDSIALSEPDAAASYPAASGWALTVAWQRERGGSAPVQTVLDVQGEATVAPSTTAVWTPGNWRWALVAARAGERVTLGSGLIRVLPDPLAATASDQRSHAQRTLEALEAAIEGRASSTDLKVTLADGRSIERLSHDELLRARDRYAAIVASDRRKAAGRGPGRVLVNL